MRNTTQLSRFLCGIFAIFLVAAGAAYAQIDPTARALALQAASQATAATASQRALQPKLQIVAAGGLMPVVSFTDSGGTSVNHDVRMPFRMGPLPARNVRVLLGDFYGDITTGNDIELGNSITVKAAIECDDVAFATIPITFRGSQSIVISNGVVLSDPLSVSLPANALCAFRGNVTITTGQSYPAGYNFANTGRLDAPGDPTAGTMNGGYTQNATSSVVYSTGNITSTGGATGYTPLAILGEVSSAEPAIVELGDSITYGQGDDGNTGFSDRLAGIKFGYAERGAVINTYHVLPYANTGRASEQLSVIANPSVGMFYNVRNRVAVFSYANAASILLGTNDLFKNTITTLTQFQTYYTRLIGELRNRGIKDIAVVTIPPLTTGSWGSAGAQTCSGAYVIGGLRDQVNAWLLTKAGGLADAVIDITPAVEDPVNHCKWIANYTADGIHPTATGAKAAGAIYNVWTQALAAKYGVS